MVLLPAPLAPTSATRAPGRDPQVNAVEDPGAVAVAQPASLDREGRVAADAQRLGGVAHRRRLLGDLLEPPGRRRGRHQMLRRRGKGREGVDGRDRQ